jgi:hypothetical protein
MITDLDIVESVTSEDGARRWQLFRRTDGLFEYREFTLDDETYWVEEDGSETDEAASTGWLPASVSGFFDSVDLARLDALSSLPWLSDRLAS